VAVHVTVKVPFGRSSPLVGDARATAGGVASILKVME